MGSFQGLDKSRIIAVPDTFAQFNPMPNLFMLGNRGDGEGMASCPRAQGWELKYLKDKKGLTRGTHIEEAVNSALIWVWTRKATRKCRRWSKEPSASHLQVSPEKGGLS
jgi:hypothetical protein